MGTMQTWPPGSKTCKILNRLGTFYFPKNRKCVLTINTRLYSAKYISFEICKEEMDDEIQQLRNLIYL